MHIGSAQAAKTSYEKNFGSSSPGARSNFPIRGSASGWSASTTRHSREHPLVQRERALILALAPLTLVTLLIALITLPLLAGLIGLAPAARFVAQFPNR